MMWIGLVSDSHGSREALERALKALGSDYCAKELPALREEDFAGVKDESGKPMV